MYNYGKPIDFGDWLIDMPDEFSFCIEDQMAMITPLDIVLVAAGLLGIIGLIWFLVTRHAKKNVEQTSNILDGLREINQGYEFYDVDAEITLEYPQDTKEDYENASFDRLFMSTVQKKIDAFEEVFGWANSNNIQFGMYKKELEDLPNWTEKDDDCGRRVPFCLYHKWEQKLVNDAVYGTPVTQPVFHVVKQYTPTRGKTLSETRTYSMAEAKEFVRLAKEHEAEKQRRAAARKAASAELRHSVLQRDGFRCTLCGRSPTEGVSLHVKPIMPLPKGEQPTADYYRTVCNECLEVNHV